MEALTNELILFAEKIKTKYGLVDTAEEIAERIELAIYDTDLFYELDSFYDIESEAAPAEKLRTLYKTEAHKGDWLQDQTGLYEIININSSGAVVKEVFFKDPNDYTSENNYYLGNETYSLSKWEVRHTYKATFNSQDTNKEE